jgi:hypothetical protein
MSPSSPSTIGSLRAFCMTSRGRQQARRRVKSFPEEVDACAVARCGELAIAGQQERVDAFGQGEVAGVVARDECLSCQMRSLRGAVSCRSMMRSL